MELLLGEWAVERRIVDLRGGGEGEFTGTARFALADGRPFHALDLAGAVEYRCGDDLYTGDYRLHGPDELCVQWDVTGPQKRQRIRSIYRRR